MAVQQTADNPNSGGIGPNKGDLKKGDIKWVTPPKFQKATSSDDGPRKTLKAKLGKMSPAQRKRLVAAVKKRKAAWEGDRKKK